MCHALQNQVLKAAFNGWSDSAAQQRHIRHEMYRIINQWQNRQLATAFSSWRQSIKDAQQMQQRNKIAHSHHVASLKAATIHSWAMYACHKSHLKAIAKTVLARWKRAAQYAVFVWWASWAERKQQLKRHGKAALQLWKHRELLAGWNAFVDNRLHCQKLRLALTYFAQDCSRKVMLVWQLRTQVYVASLSELNLNRAPSPYIMLLLIPMQQCIQQPDECPDC
jgi:hypothetical protein